jgi:ADP-ribosylation factor GTPase-activating protein 1
VKTARPKPQRARSRTPLPPSGSRSASPATVAAASQKERNEAYFARLHQANETRPDHLPPSQGGKYAGFGSAPAEPQTNDSGLDITKDPMGALTKGWGFFATQATKAAQLANEQVLKPTAQKLAEADLARTAAQLGQGVQGVGRLGYENFNKFVEGPGNGNRRRGMGPEPEHKDFWETFGEPAAPKPSAIGTSAMKKAPTGTGASTTSTTAATKKKEDGWDNDDWDKF